MMKYGGKITPRVDRIDLHEAYMSIAEIWAKRSKSHRNQVGAILVKNGRIISDGYNGKPAGDEDDACEVWVPNMEHLSPNGGFHIDQMSTLPSVLHAESNAILKLARFGGESAEGSDLYITTSPCIECSKLVIQSGIRRVFYREVYRDTSGIEQLVKFKIKAIHLPKPKGITNVKDENHQPGAIRCNQSCTSCGCS